MYSLFVNWLYFILANTNTIVNYGANVGLLSKEVVCGFVEDFSQDRFMKGFGRVHRVPYSLWTYLKLQEGPINKP